MANILPQHQGNNDGIWRVFESYSRSLLQRDKCESVEVISGPIYSKDKPYADSAEMSNIFRSESVVLMKNGVVAPDELYKIIKCNRREGSYLDGFRFSNSGGTK